MCASFGKSLPRTWVLGVYVALALGIFFPTLKAPYYYDDDYVIKQNLWIKEVPQRTWYAQSHADSGHFFPGYRPTLVASYWLNAKLTGLDLKASLRLGNIILHALNAFLLYCLTLKFLKGRRGRYAAVVAGALFLLHPIQSLGVVFIWKRSSLLLGTFLLLGILHLLWVMQKQRPWHAKNGHALLWSFILHGMTQVILCVGALTSKEEGIIYPIMIGMTALVANSKEALSKRFIAVWALIFAALLLGFLWKLGLLGINIFSPERVAYFQASLSVIPEYFKLMLLPHPRILDEPARLLAWLTPQSTVLFVLLLLSLGGLAVFWRRWPSLAIAMIWVGFLPSQTFQPLLLIMDQIRMYVPLMGFAMLLAALLSYQPLRLGRVITALLMFTLATASFRQSLRYQNFEAVWKDVTSEYPQSFVAWDNLGAYYERQGRYPQAVEAFDRAAAANPSNLDFIVRGLLSRLRNGEPEEELRQRARDVPIEGTTDAMAILHYAYLTEQLDLLDVAERYATHFVKHFPGYAFGHYVLARIFAKTERVDQARGAFRYALKLDPELEHARRELAAL